MSARFQKYLLIDFILFSIKIQMWNTAHRRKQRQSVKVYDYANTRPYFKLKILAYLSEIVSMDFVLPVHLSLFPIFINSKQGSLFTDKTLRLSLFSDLRISYQSWHFMGSSFPRHVVQAKGPFLFLIISKCRLPTYLKASVSLEVSPWQPTSCISPLTNG